MFLKSLKPMNLSLQVIRCYGKHNKNLIYKDGVRYELVTYYPRDPNQEDPAIIPSKLFRVQRIKPVKGTPYWERKILKDLGLIEKASDFAIVKNIPENNARLWKIKHLIKIEPITFPYGEPNENDLDNTILKENGECIVRKELKVDNERIKVTEEFQNDPKRIDTDLLRKDSRLKWLNPW